MQARWMSAQLAPGRTASMPGLLGGEHQVVHPALDGGEPAVDRQRAGDVGGVEVRGSPRRRRAAAARRGGSAVVAPPVQGAGVRRRRRRSCRSRRRCRRGGRAARTRRRPAARRTSRSAGSARTTSSKPRTVASTASRSWSISHASFTSRSSRERACSSPSRAGPRPRRRRPRRPPRRSRGAPGCGRVEVGEHLLEVVEVGAVRRRAPRTLRRATSGGRPTARRPGCGRTRRSRAEERGPPVEGAWPRRTGRSTSTVSGSYSPVR